MEQKDKELRALFSKTKLRASDNMEHRIMQQIRTEKALVKASEQKSISTKSLVSQIFAIYGIMLVLILVLYLIIGDTNQFYTTSLGILLVGGLYYFISVFDDSLRMKEKKKKI